MRKALLAAVVAALAVALSSGASSAGEGAAGISIKAPMLTLAGWQADSDNLRPVRGTIAINGLPVTGVRLRVDGYQLPFRSDRDGRFTYLVDATRLARHVVTVADATGGRTNGVALSRGAQRAMVSVSGSIDVAYAIHDLRVGRNSAGQPTVEGRIADASGTPPPTVVLYSYELVGHVVDSRGRPVVGARVSTRTVDRDYWTVSSATKADGSFESLFTASSGQGGNPVPMTLRVAVGDLLYSYLPREFVAFQRLQSASLEVRLPPRGYPMALPVPRSYPGAIYEGVVVGASVGGTVVRPVRVMWPDASGRFTLVLPRRFAGRTVSLWEDKLQLFSRVASRAGGSVDLRDWPSQLPQDAPRDVARAHLK
jgi:hypothetical protein